VRKTATGMWRNPGEWNTEKNREKYRVLQKAKLVRTVGCLQSGSIKQVEYCDQHASLFPLKRARLDVARVHRKVAKGPQRLASALEGCRPPERRKSGSREKTSALLEAFERGSSGRIPS
jgi:hypothetical protein